MIAKKYLLLYSRLIYTDIFKVNGWTADAKERKKERKENVKFRAVFSKAKYFCMKK